MPSGKFQKEINSSYDNFNETQNKVFKLERNESLKDKRCANEQWHLQDPMVSKQGISNVHFLTIGTKFFSYSNAYSICRRKRCSCWSLGFRTGSIMLLWSGIGKRNINFRQFFVSLFSMVFNVHKQTLTILQTLA